MHLSQKNIGKSLNTEDLAYEVDVLEQFEQLTENIHKTETLERSLELKSHIEAFKDVQEGDDILLKEINRKLKD